MPKKSRNKIIDKTEDLDIKNDEDNPKFWSQEKINSVEETRGVLYVENREAVNKIEDGLKEFMKSQGFHWKKVLGGGWGIFTFLLFLFSFFLIFFLPFFLLFFPSQSYTY